MPVTANIDVKHPYIIYPNKAIYQYCMEFLLFSLYSTFISCYILLAINLSQKKLSAWIEQAVL